MLSDTGEYLFTCKDCGSHELDVFHTYTTTSKFRFADHEQHMLYEGTFYEEWDEWGHMIEEHDVEYYGRMTTDTYEEVDNWYDLDESELPKYAEDKEYEEAEVDEDSVEFYVKCSKCNREIEFGWSRPNS